ncbi:MAG: hypothetical protein A3A57_02005 [Candidatus Woykebacteria bacterium RIFCSPLOWO2_01_FULL_41_12]|uniref:Uncharacterized protein n=1 Tax=Candidatus Woykebacteria bacterium RIFCSPLOWO2_01_FULL_41_12 TaxID=1802604 RepID=A0A1G1WU83_9BACT|nr:MAG: hypothetical protein A3A57_02005 [Candidatus Woykebacteria bacterium RIFCSPLOWO2_01_FULL_41_12]
MLYSKQIAVSCQLGTIQPMKKIIRGLILSLPSLFTLATPAFAQTFTFDTARVPFTDLGKLLSNALILLFFFAAVLAFIFIVVGGIQWITAGGDKMAAQSARDRITAAVVGLLIVVAAFGITWIITSVFGINIFQPGGVSNFPGTTTPAFPDATPQPGT